jgi:hypothetical protein
MDGRSFFAVPASSSTSASNDQGFGMTAGAGVSGWELALVTTASSNDSALSQSKLVILLSFTSLVTSSNDSALSISKVVVLLRLSSYFCSL